MPAYNKKENALDTCMYERGEGGREALDTAPKKQDQRPKTLLCPLLLLSPAEGRASPNITFFSYQVRTTPHNSYSFEDMT